MTFVPACQEVVAPGARPRRTVFLLHGIFGSGRNWRSFAGLLAERRPELRVCLVDLRCHGASQNAPPPHDLAACAADLRALAERLGRPPEVVCGHSLGGKVALVYARDLPQGLEEVWSLDSPPGPTAPAIRLLPTDAGRVLEAVSALTLPIRPRSAATRALLQAGIPRDISLWMATNLRLERGGGHSWRFDLGGARDLLADYWALDGLAIMADLDQRVAIHVMRGGRSDRWSERDLEGVRALAEHGRVRLSVLEGAGHWPQVDDPGGLLDLLAPAAAKPGDD
ncbi:MAG: alpha/beta hydrolase [Planctomycetes bacterium]|nr:alpha/beta hydrolase [Planctomycetota bacterium]